MKLLALLFSLALVDLALGAENTSPPAPATHEIDFTRDIQPLLARSCLKCHGPEKQKGGYRLDSAESALHGGDDSAPNIHPGDSAESPLIKMVTSPDAEARMPVKGEALTAPEVDLLRAWVDQGAKWPVDANSTRADPFAWWSLRPLVEPPVPASGHPIDAFIRQMLSAQKLTPSPEADPRTLIRRLYFDLHGLPPTPEEVDSYVADTDPRKYEILVDRLLASPRYGERWARHWLDVAHYGDTHGYDKDQLRPHAWPYRDYVIRAFNEDRPYGRFVQEQLAGDLLYPGTRDGVEALGFIAAGPWDLIGHTEVPESKIDGKIARNLDRDDMVSTTLNAFCSLTVQCARCHNHKFDPVSQENYYSLQADFAALDRADRTYDLDPMLASRRRELQAAQGVADQQRESLLAVGVAAAGAPLRALDERLALLPKAGLNSSPPADAYGYHSQLAPTAEVVKWVQLDLGTPTTLRHVALHPCRDSFNGIGDGFGFPPRFKVELSDDVNFTGQTAVVCDQTGSDFANPGISAVDLPVSGITARYLRMTATKIAPRQNEFNFALAEIEAFDGAGQNLARHATVSALDSIEAAPRWRQANLVDGSFPGAQRAGDPEDLSLLQAKRAKLVLAALSPAQRHDLSAAEASLAQVSRELAALPAPSLVYAGTIHHGTGDFTGTGPTGGQPRIIHLLARGDVTNPRQEVGPGAVPLAVGQSGHFDLPPAAAEGDRRVALARWITDDGNPLTWRSIVNRVWQYHFGRGLVDSPNDFGHMGQLPSHPELLDWLAADFRDHGQSCKRLHRLIVTSATYRQSSVSYPQGEALDRDNTFLWRMNRRKLEAEAIRDSVLQVAGQLDLTMGGPGFQDFSVDKPEHSPHYEYDRFDSARPEAHRRSIYRFIVRSQPQPYLAALDCADPSMSVDKRNQTLTPLQALALLNNTFMLGMSEQFAQRLAMESPNLPEQLDRAYRLALDRLPSAREHIELADYARQHGLANTCRLILNLNEFVFVD